MIWCERGQMEDDNNCESAPPKMLPIHIVHILSPYTIFISRRFTSIFRLPSSGSLADFFCAHVILSVARTRQSQHILNDIYTVTGITSWPSGCVCVCNMVYALENVSQTRSFRHFLSPQIGAFSKVQHYRTERSSFRR